MSPMREQCLAWAEQSGLGQTPGWVHTGQGRINLERFAALAYAAGALGKAIEIRSECALEYDRNVTYVVVQMTRETWEELAALEDAQP